MVSLGKGTHIVPEKTFTVTMWTLCFISLGFLASRFAVRITTQGRLMINDYFLVAAVPCLLTGFALLQSVIHILYRIGNMGDSTMFHPINDMRRLVAAMELIWVAIYCVKFCYLAQFKFYKPPYAYVNATLTAYYWVAVGCCSVGFVFTIIQPIVLCRMPDKCAYTDGSNTRPWEFAITAIDIVTDVIVVSIPALLIQMTHIVRVETVANFVFKSLSICNIVVAATRLALQYNTKDHRNDRIQYVSVAFLLVVEATVAIVMAAISGYRIVFLRRLAEWRQRKAAKATRLTVRHPTAAGELQAESTKATDQQDGSLSNLPILSNT